MKIVIGLFLMMFALISHTALAGTELGNGGNVIYCTDGLNDHYVKLLDYYEGEIWNGLTLSFPKEGDFLQKADQILDRLQNFDPQLASAYKKRIREIYADFNLIPNINLGHVQDSYELAIPANCETRQIVVRLHDINPGQKRFQVSQDLWNQLDANNQAGVLLHEVIYEHFSQNLKIDEISVPAGFHESNSTSSRKLNAMIASEEFQKFTIQSYSKFQQKIDGIQSMVVYGLRFYIDPGMTFYPNGSLQSGTVLGSATLTTPYGDVRINATTVKFYDNGILQSVDEVQKNNVIQVNDRVYTLGSLRTAAGVSDDAPSSEIDEDQRSLTFSPDGKLKTAFLGNNQPSSDFFDGIPFSDLYPYSAKCIANPYRPCKLPVFRGSATFDANGRMTKATLYAQDAFQVEGRDRQMYSYKINYTGDVLIQFDKDGFILPQN